MIGSLRRAIQGLLLLQDNPAEHEIPDSLALLYLPNGSLLIALGFIQPYPGDNHPDAEGNRHGATAGWPRSGYKAANSSSW